MPCFILLHNVHYCPTQVCLLCVSPQNCNSGAIIYAGRLSNRNHKNSRVSCIYSEPLKFCLKFSATMCGQWLLSWAAQILHSSLAAQPVSDNFTQKELERSASLRLIICVQKRDASLPTPLTERRGPLEAAPLFCSRRGPFLGAYALLHGGDIVFVFLARHKIGAQKLLTG